MILSDSPLYVGVEDSLGHHYDKFITIDSKFVLSNQILSDTTSIKCGATKVA